MSSTLETVAREGEPLEKAPSETSLRPIQGQTQFDGIDDADASDSHYSHHGFSRNDRSDMHRMGKVQELKVCNSSDCIAT